MRRRHRFTLPSLRIDHIDGVHEPIPDYHLPALLLIFPNLGCSCERRTLIIIQGCEKSDLITHNIAHSGSWELVARLRSDIRLLQV